MAGAALPDGRRALSASADKPLKLWDLETGNPLAAFTADSDLFAVAANDRFVAGSHDGRLHILRHLT
jgi:WD40 repeat protein